MTGKEVGYVLALKPFMVWNVTYRWHGHARVSA